MDLQVIENNKHKADDNTCFLLYAINRPADHIFQTFPVIAR